MPTPMNRAVALSHARHNARCARDAFRASRRATKRGQTDRAQWLRECAATHARRAIECARVAVAIHPRRPAFLMGD